ncbi:MAG: TlpA family protein disulfide reductase [Butyricimonas paravirosa]
MTYSLAKAQQDDRVYRESRRESPEHRVIVSRRNQETTKRPKGKVIMIQFTASWCGVCRGCLYRKRHLVEIQEQPRVCTLRYRLQREQRNHRKVAKDIKITYPYSLTGRQSILHLRRAGGGVTRNIIDKKVTSPSSPVSTTRKFEEMVKVIDKLKREIKRGRLTSLIWCLKTTPNSPQGADYCGFSPV